MKRLDIERSAMLQESLQQAGLDAFACVLPMNVLMVSGYWPMLGNSVAVVTRDGALGLVIPEDDRTLAELAEPDVAITYRPATLDHLTEPGESIREPLRSACERLGLQRTRIGIETQLVSLTVGYSAVNVWLDSTRIALAKAVPSATVLPADAAFRKLRSIKSSREISNIARACELVKTAFRDASAAMSRGISEVDAAHCFRQGLADEAANRGPHRADGFVWCMSGPNAAQAGAAFARSKSRKIQANETVLIHANSYIDGYWTDVTRTYVLGEPTPEVNNILDAVLEARAAGLKSIAAGVKASDVDHAVRQVIEKHGYGNNFPHGAGHGVGFGAIDANAHPRIHPASDDILSPGMVFNLEPGIYVAGLGGIRICDMVTLNSAGAKLLTDFQNDRQSLVLSAGLNGPEQIAA